MKERPILFGAPMVCALMNDSKTQTRRLIKPQPTVTEARLRELGGWIEGMTLSQQVNAAWQHGFIDDKCRYGQPGDRLWVKETFAAFGRWETRYSEKKRRDEWHFIDMTLECGLAYRFAADSDELPHMRARKDAGALPDWWKRPSIFMPRLASRITLEITGVCVEQLQDISEADAMAEGINLEGEGIFFAGIYGTASHTAKDSYRLLWESLNGEKCWDANQWVRVIEFRRLTA